MGFVKMGSASTERARMAAMGAVAGLALWVLADVLPDQINNARALMFLAALAGAFFAALLAASGPLRAGQAALVGLLVSVVPSVLFLWASFRFETVEDYLETGHPLVAFAILASLPVPFMIAALGPVGNWRDYPELFNQSWNIVVRYVASWLFLGLFWAVVLLSNALFGIIGLEIINTLLEIAPVPYVLSGLVLGLALAVVNELKEYVSPYLVLRLLRLLLPVVLVVVAIFVAMVPLRGLSGLFGGLSVASTLMAMALGGITLVSTAIDQSDDEAVTMPFMRLASQILALILPVLAGLAVLSIWVRVNQYGWSPERLAATAVAGVVLVYALLYAIAVLRRHRWMADIRQFNTYMALAVMVVAALWLTPVMNPQRISANNQLARYQQSRTQIKDLDLWSIGKEWGVAGRRVAPLFAEVEREGQDVVAEQLAALDKTDDFYTYDQLLSGPQSDRMREFLNLVPVRPVGADIPEGVFGTAATPAGWIESCGRRTAAKNPGCALLVADFLPDHDGPEILLATKQTGDWVRIEMWSRTETGQWRNHGLPARLTGPEVSVNSDEVIDRIIAEEFDLVPATVNTIGFGDTRFIMLP